MNDEELIMGFCWYQKEQWQRLQEIVPDPDDLDESYEVWRRNAEQAFNELRQQGMNIVKVAVDIEELLAWCDEAGRPVDSEARSEYGAYLLQKREKLKSRGISHS